MTEQTYFQKYWEKKKDVLNAARRQRYRKDAEYRSKARQRARRYWQKKRADDKPADRTVVVGYDGLQYCTISRVAAFINRSAFTVREYCRSNIIPPATFYSQHGARLYSMRQVALMVKTFHAFDAGILKSLQQVEAALRKDWEDGKEEKCQ